MIEGYCVGGAFMQLLAVDFVVTADKPIYMMQYMSSSQNTNVPAIRFYRVLAK